MTRRTALFAAAPVALLAADPATEKSIMASMDALRASMLAPDTATLSKLLHADLIYSHSTGVNETKEQAIAAIHKQQYTSVEYGKLAVRTFGSTALVKGGVVIKSGPANSIPSNLDVLWVWLKEPSGWQLVGRQATRLNP